MKLLVDLLLVLGFCVGTAGAAGFARPQDPAYASAHPTATTERLAWPLFAAGLVLMGVGGFLSKTAKRAELARGAAADGGTRGRFVRELAAVRAVVEGLDDHKASLGPEELRDRIDHLLANEYFDLVSRNEEIAADLGFQAYAQVWEGIATAERLLARVWSLATDGYPDEARLELPRARRELDRAAEAAARL